MHRLLETLYNLRENGNETDFSNFLYKSDRHGCLTKLTNAFQHPVGKTIKNLSSRTVNKLRSRNLLFSCMCRIERKIVHVGTEKIVTLY